MAQNSLPPTMHCSLCDLEYAPSDAGDRQMHATYHARVDKLAAHLGRRPVGYSERERQKKEGDDLRLNGATLDEKLRGADLVLTALYDREVLLRLRRSRPGPPPSFEKFLRTQDIEAIVGQQLAPDVRRRHGL